MKSIFLATFLMIFTLGAFAQLRKVPAEVTNALKAKYPNAQNVEWKDKLTYFEASFTDNESELSADFSNNGEWRETDKKMDFDNLPAEVKDGLKKSKYADWTTGSVTMIEKSDKSVQYKIYVEKSSIIQKKFLYFNKGGQMVRDTPGI